MTVVVQRGSDVHTSPISRTRSTRFFLRYIVLFSICLICLCGLVKSLMSVHLIQIFEDQSNQLSSDIRVSLSDSLFYSFMRWEAGLHFVNLVVIVEIEQVELTLSLYEAVKGCTKRLEFDAYVFCDSCGELSALLYLLISENQLWCAEFPVKILEIIDALNDKS